MSVTNAEAEPELKLMTLSEVEDCHMSFELLLRDSTAFKTSPTAPLSNL